MRGLQCGDPIQTADGIAIAIGNGVVARLVAKNSPGFAPELPPPRKPWKRQK
jgi:hypothetical protein